MKSLEVSVGAPKNIVKVTYSTSPWPQVADVEMNNLQLKLDNLKVPLKTPAKQSLSWYWSRLCLLNSLESIDCTKPFAFSLAHTENMVIAASLNRHGSIIGVGIDCENKHRKIDNQVGPRISKNGDHLKFKNPIEFWVSKESSFKANPENSGKVLSDVEILSDHQAIFGNAKIEFEVIEVEEHLVAIALAFGGDNL